MTAALEFEAAQLLHEFPDWEIAAYPGGLDVWSAVHRSADGRHIRAIIARTAADLAEKLQAAGPVQP